MVSGKIVVCKCVASGLMHEVAWNKSKMLRAYALSLVTIK